jgi:plastocyanin
MRRYPLWIVALCGALISATVFAGEAAKTGIVKGTITIAGRPSADVVVSVEGVPQEQNKTQLSGGKVKAVMEQKDLKFIPRVLAVLVQTTVEFPNHDKTFHNVFSNSEAKKFDLGLYPSGKSRSVTFDKPGVVKILCNAHPNMEAYIVVKNHRYFSVADARGNYTLSGVPLGKYRVEVWHPELGTRQASVELVSEGEVLDINFDLKK